MGAIPKFSFEYRSGSPSSEIDPFWLESVFFPFLSLSGFLSFALSFSNFFFSHFFSFDPWKERCVFFFPFLN